MINRRNKFKKKERIKKREEFKKVLQEGVFLKSKFYNFCFKKNDLGFNRIGIVIKKVYGNSILRNYEKRIVREFFRNNKGVLKKNFDIIIFIKKEASFLEKRDLFNKKKEDFLYNLRRIENFYYENIK